MRTNRFNVWLRACAMALSALASSAQGKDRAATLSVLDGQAVIIHATAKLAAAEGAALEPEDIIETSATTSFARLEFGDGAVLDLGPSTRVIVKPAMPGVHGGDAAKAYALAGWVKLSMDQGRPGSTPALTTPLFDLAGVERDFVVNVQAAEGGVFAASGPLTVWAKGKTGKAAASKLARGAFLARRPDGSVEVTLRPPQAFIQAVPRPFMDTLPSRAALFKGKDIKLAAAGKLTYADTEAWLNAEPRIRTRFLTRWRALLQDDAFRKALAAQLNLHPEWHPILYAPPPQQSGHKPYPTIQAVKP